MDANNQQNEMNGIVRIKRERQRQIEKEGWTAEHDTQHNKGELALAAKAYIWSEWVDDETILNLYWPWDKKWWKPENRIRNLEKAGALIAAEIDRLLRI